MELKVLFFFFFFFLKALLSEEENLLIINRLHQVLRPFVLRRLKHKVQKCMSAFIFFWNLSFELEMQFTLFRLLGILIFLKSDG